MANSNVLDHQDPSKPETLPPLIHTATAKALAVDVPDRYHSEPHHVKIIHVGAGASGLLAAYKAERMLRNYELVVYEKYLPNLRISFAKPDSAETDLCS